MKPILAFACLALTSCAGTPAMLTASYSGTTSNGDSYNVGLSVPLRTGKETKKVTP